MTAEVMKSFGTLQLELEQARTSLKDVDEHIKKLLGRDPVDQSRQNLKRPPPGNPDEPRGRGRINLNFNNRIKHEVDEPITKKRNIESSVFKRLSERPRHFEDAGADNFNRNQLISKVIVTPKEIPSRQDVLAAQGADEKSKARNRRMFGALLGTLQKFRQEETKLKPKEEKRAQVEKKLEEQQIREREELKKERQDLFLNRKRKQQEIRMIELKMTRLKELADWEDKQRPLMSFIQTKTKPHIYYLPKILNDQTKNLLEVNKQSVEKMIDRKRQDVYSELSDIEQKMKRNFMNKQTSIDADNKEDFTLEDDEVEMKEEFLEDRHTDQDKQITEDSNHSQEIPTENNNPDQEIETIIEKEEISNTPEPVEITKKEETESDKEEDNNISDDKIEVNKENVDDDTEIAS